ncbi:hypothetical protein PHYPO_G00192310 [Pangasianodon hypophthalmus]|uniref:Uncharacterized protein n=2 Tax=Pangasiidae TaxID=7999 RepID=A0A5N5PKC4_PANHP|nr:hypothetical protein PHYPO_G00192310 [Pangasianodon hypophthalmus]
MQTPPLCMTHVVAYTAHIRLTLNGWFKASSQRCYSTNTSSFRTQTRYMKRSCEFEQLDAAAVMYGSAGLPELIPPACALRPSAVLPYSPGPGAGDRHGAQLSSNPRRMHRAPKLGQIGRSKRVDIDDEDLDDIMNNNRSFPLSISVSPVA